MAEYSIPPQVDTGSDEPGLGSINLDSVFSGDEKLDDVGQALALEFLGRSEQIQLARLDCIAQSARLAGEQIQDVRLDLLEAGPEVNTTLVVVDLFVGFLLDADVPGKLLKAFAQSTCKNLVLRSRVLYTQQFGAMRAIVSDRSKWRLPQELDKALAAQVRAKEYLANAELWRRVGEIASNEDVRRVTTALAKTARSAGKSKLATRPLGTDGDTPGVSLVGSVDEFVGVNRLQTLFQYERMRTLVRLKIMTSSEIRKLLRLAEFDATGSPLKEIRDRCKLLFEAMIWAAIYGYDRSGMSRLRAGSLTSQDRLQGIDQRLARYWVRRFGADIEKWGQDLGEVGRHALGLGDVSNWDQLEYVRRLGLVEQYFRRILAGLPESLARAKAIATAFDVTPR